MKVNNLIDKQEFVGENISTKMIESYCKFV